MAKNLMEEMKRLRQTIVESDVDYSGLSDNPTLPGTYSGQTQDEDLEDDRMKSTEAYKRGWCDAVRKLATTMKLPREITTQMLEYTRDQNIGTY
jgi:hypothetical protein